MCLKSSYRVAVELVEDRGICHLVVKDCDRESAAVTTERVTTVSSRANHLIDCTRQLVRVLLRM